MKSLTSAFNNLKVNAKIMLGFAVVLVIMIGVAVSGYKTLADISHEFDTFTQRVKVVGIARDVDREFLAYLRLVREYAVSGKDEDAAKANDARPQLAAAIETALKEIKNPERLAKMKEISEEFAKYTTNFEKLSVLRQSQVAQVRDVLDPNGVKLRLDLEELQKAAAKDGDSNAVILAGTAMEHVMAVRLNVNKMLARHEEAAREAADKAFEDVKTAMAGLGKVAASGTASALFADVNERVETYHNAYEKAADDMFEIDALVNGEMKKSAEDIAVRAAEIKKSGIEDEHKLELETVATIGSGQNFVLILSLVGLALGTVLAWLIGRGISTPIRAIADVLLALANGNKSVEVPYADRGDEVGENARAAQIFKENLLRIEKMEAEQKAVEARAAGQRKADMRRMADDFQKAVGSIVDAVSSASSQLESAAVSLTGTASSTQTLSGAVAAASEETSANVQGVAAASEQLSSTVTEISRQVQQSSTIASQAVSQAAKTNDRVNELSQSADRIGDVIGLINTIAGQTNLLALNATIEAARAGDAGKGFAVVAQEVKALAAQTAKATSEIATQISSMQSATGEAVGAIREITETINKISEISGAIAAAVEQQGATTQEISRNVMEAAKGTAEVASNITEVSRGAGETGTASSQVLSSAKALSGESQQLKSEVEKFLSTVRAA
jgi:methyl-accepting chemotaxis protein